MPIIINTSSAINASRKMCLILTSLNPCDHHEDHHGDADEQYLKSDMTADVSVPDYGPDGSTLGFDLGAGDDAEGENSYGLYHQDFGS